MMVTEIFLSFLEVSISASLIIVLLILLTPFLNKRYAAKWKYWLWIFIALRLVIPYSGTDRASVVDALSQIKTQTVVEAEKDHTDHTPEQAAAPRRVIIAVPEQMTAPIAMQSEKNGNGITMLDIVAYVWMIGSLAFLSVHLISYVRYKRQAVKKGTNVKDIPILRLVYELKCELHIKDTVRVIKYPEASSPMMVGFLKPVLILPDEQYSSEELFFILKHELVHLKRKDLYVKLLFVIANAVHWFNPLIWLMQKEAAVDLELSCDERVTQGINYAMRKAYTETLLSAFHKQCKKKNTLSTQFYGGKQIMKKRFKNILIKTRKKNGAVILIFIAVLTVGLGTLVGCSVGQENTEDISGQAENSSHSEEGDLDVSGANGMEDELPEEEIPAAAVSDGEATAENTMILTIMKEGEPEEKQASLVLENGYLIYLPYGEWQKKEADMWQATVNENVRLWVSHFEKDHPIEQALTDDGYVQENGELVKQEDGIIYKVRIHEDDSNVWCISYCYPVEAEEGWGKELPVIADTFALTVSAEIIYGYISVLDNGSVTIDRQIWVTPESEDWKPEYNEAGGFEVVDAEGDDITYPLHENCTFIVLENHYDPTIELSGDEFADYLTEMEYPVLWILTVEDGQVRSIREQYIP